MALLAKDRFFVAKELVILKSSLVINALTLPVLTVCCLLSEFRASGIVAVTALIVALFFLLKQRPLILLKYLAVVFAWVSTIAGCVVIEYSDMYLSELTLVSYYVGCIPLYCLSCWTCFVALLLIDAKLEGNDRCVTAYDESENRNGLTHYASVAILVFLCVLFASVITKPSFVLGVDRFEYSALYSLGFLGVIANYMNWLIVVPMIALRNGEKILGGTCIALYCLYLLWTGTKFGGFFIVLCYVPLVYYDRICQLNKAHLAALIRKFGVVFSVLLLVAVASFVAMSEKSATQYIQERTAQQGQLWWRTFALSDGDSHTNELINEYDATLNPKDSIASNVGSNNGIYKIMYYCAPESLVDNKLLSGSRYSSAGYAAAYYYFGALGPLVFAVGVAFLFAVFTNLVVKAGRGGNLVMTVLSARLLRITSSVASMFLFSELVEPLSVISYFVLAIWAFWGGHRIAHKRKLAQKFSNYNNYMGLKNG